MAPDLQTPTSFSDLPNDVHINILSFLQPTDISAFACTCRRFAALCSPSSPSTDLWMALCDRRWGSKTQLRRWSAVPSPRLYKTLDRWENLIGFWRRIGSGISETPRLVFFEWSSSCIIGFRISRSPVAASYAVCKTPFLWLGFSAAGETSSYLTPHNRLSDSDVIPVTIKIMGYYHLWVEESRSSRVNKLLDDSEEWPGLETGSPPDRLMSEIYQYFAYRTSPGADKSTRRLRKKVKERLGRKGWEAEHFFKISNYFPTLSRPLQGLWKGISEDMCLEFYLVTHDNVGALACWRIGDSVDEVSGYFPVFWTSNTTFTELPFSKDALALYITREHVRSAGLILCNMDREIVSRIMRIYYCYNLVPPYLAGSSCDPGNVQGMIWEYEDETFGFGLLRNNFIIDLKPIVLDGLILDEVESFNQNSAS